MKKLLCFFTALCLLTALVTTTALADTRPASDIAVNLNGTYLIFDVDPIIENGRTLVPFRGVFEALGCEVSWDDQARTAIGLRSDATIKLPIANHLAKVNGESVYLDQPAIIKDGRTLVPLRFVAEALGADVSWNDAERTVYISADFEKAKMGSTFLFTAASFADVGTWGRETSSGGTFPDGALKGAEHSTASLTTPATVKFNVTDPGTYYTWVRSRDFPNDRPGIRYFDVEIAGTNIGRFGNHGNEGYAWTQGSQVTLDAGIAEIKLLDTAAFYGRCDAVLITKEASFVPSNTYTELTELVTPFVAGGDVDATNDFPAYANEQAAPSATAEIADGDTKVTFYTVPTSGGTVIQNEISVQENGAWIVTKQRSEDFGYLILAADTAKKAAPMGEAAAFSTTYRVGANYKAYYGTNVYNAGRVYWAIPGAVSVSGNTATVTAENDVAAVTAVWTVAGGQITVSVTATYKADGAYSIGMFEGREIPFDQIESVNAHGAVENNDVRPDPGILLTEGLIAQPSASYLLTAQNMYTPGYAVLKGVAAQDYTGSWGIALRGVDGNFRATLVAPVLGEADAAVTAGGSQTVTYRIISEIGQ